MNTNQINNRKAAFAIAMENDNSDLHHAIAPAELMAILHHCDPLHYDAGIDVLLETTEVDETLLMEYMDSNACGEHDWNSALNTFLMDPVRAQLNKIKYEKGLLADDEILAFALFLVGDSLLVKEALTGREPEYDDTADLVNHVASRLKFLLMCINEGKYALLNTAIEYARREMSAFVDTSFCFDEITPSDGGVIEYYQFMTDHRVFGKKYGEWKNQFKQKFKEERAKMACEGLKKRLRTVVNEDEETDEISPSEYDEPLVERDFEG